MESAAVAAYRQTDVGDVPGDWCVRTLLQLADGKKELFDDGDWVEARYLTDNGIRLIQTGNIGEGYFVEKHDSKKFISEESFTALRCKDLRIGDLLICRLAEPAGRACVLPDIRESRMITAVDVTIFRPRHEVADRRYLQHVFSTHAWFHAVDDRCGGSTRSRISRSALGRIAVGVPGLNEQRAIADALGDVDALLDALDRQIAKQRDLKQAAMQQLLTGRTRLPGFTGAWRTRRIGDIASIRSGGTPSTSDERFWNGDVPWCTPTDITALAGRKHLERTERTITGEGLGASSAELIPARSIIMTSRATIGECAINAIPVATNQGFKNLVPANATDVDFLYYLLATQKQGFIRLCGGSTFLELSKSQLAAYELSLPPTKPEQTAIAAVLSDMDAEITALEARRVKTRALKQAMMQELLTGKTRLV